jgi:hypothetical protein
VKIRGGGGGGEGVIKRGLHECAKEEDAIVGGSSWDISRWRVSSSSLLRDPLLEVRELEVGV